MKRLIYCITVALLVVSCIHYDIDELLAAPEQVDIEGKSLVMSVYLCINPPPENDLEITVHILTADSSYFPQWLDADEVWVIDGDNIWHDDLIHGISYLIPWLMTKYNKNAGPQWNAGIYADVVVQLIDDTGNTYLIREPDVFINAC